MARFTVADEPYGNLYKNCRVEDFKIYLEPTKSPPDFFNQVHHDSCDLIVLGDSHFRNWPGGYWFPVELQFRLNRPVYHMKVMRHPFLYLNRSGLKKMSHRRICLLESGEARITDRYYNMPDLQPRKPEAIDEVMFGLGKDKFTAWERVSDRWFVGTEKSYSYFLKNNVLLRNIVDWYYTTLFRQFGKISDLTPVYSLDPPLLIEHQQVMKRRPSSYYYYHDGAMVDRIADNLKMVSDSLSSTYNLELVFLPVPNTMTIHHSFITDRPYDGFLPRLCDALEERGVHVIRLYELYTREEGLLYHPADNHWNAKGARIAFEETIRIMQPILAEIDNQADMLGDFVQVVE